MLLGIVVAVLLMGMVTALFFPREKVKFENRYSNQLPALTLKGYLDGSFQEGMDAGLSDQVNFFLLSKVI